MAAHVVLADGSSVRGGIQGVEEVFGSRRDDTLNSGALSAGAVGSSFGFIHSSAICNHYKL